LDVPTGVVRSDSGRRDRLVPCRLIDLPVGGTESLARATAGSGERRSAIYTPNRG